MPRRVIRNEIPLDGQWHNLPLTGHPETIAIHPTRRAIVIWSEHDDLETPILFTFKAFADDHQLPPQARYVATAVSSTGHSKHLYRLTLDTETP